MCKVLELNEKEIHEKALELNVSQAMLNYVEDELETKSCKDCGHLIDSSDYEFSMNEFKSMLFCTQCGGELEDNNTLDVYECLICNSSLQELGEGYIFEEQQKGVCYDCYDSIPEVILTEEEKQKREEEAEKKKSFNAANPLRMISPSQLVGKTISRSYQIKWNGAMVIHTTDNCICVAYSSYDFRTGVTEFDHLTSLDDYFRFC